MGSTQTKCSCGNFTSVEILVTDKTEEDDLKVIVDETGCEKWISTAENATFATYCCDSCSVNIIEKLSKSTKIDYKIKKSEQGYFTTDLP
jgi:hypothetical protein